MMTAMRGSSSLALFALAVAGCGGASAPDAGSPDGGSAIDAGARDASVPDAGADDAAVPDVDAGPCTQHELGASIQLARGLVVARDGTLYVSQLGGAGRVDPDGTVDASWLRIDGVTTVAGLALDPPNETLFVAAPDGGGTGAASLYAVSIGSRTATPIASGGFPYGLAWGPDGMLYYADVATSHVHRVSPSGGAPEQVTSSPISSPRGIAFEGSGSLLVASASPGQLFRLTLSASGRETARETVGAPLPTPTFIAIDALGRIYLTSEFGGFLVRTNADGSEQAVLRSELSSPFALDFGHGALCARDIYLVAGNGQVFRFENDTRGADVSWH